VPLRALPPNLSFRARVLVAGVHTVRGICFLFSVFRSTHSFSRAATRTLHPRLGQLSCLPFRDVLTWETIRYIQWRNSPRAGLRTSSNKEVP
jgi:hypothetical protein